MPRLTSAPPGRRHPHADSQEPAAATFDTPTPISVTAELGVGDLRITASDRSDTVVEVRPSHPGRKTASVSAQQTRVEYADGRLTIKGPQGWRRYSFWGSGDAIDVRIELPSGSHVRGETGMGALRSVGRLGECDFTTGLGEIHLDTAGPVHLRTGGGDISVDRSSGDAELTTGTGVVQVGSIDGAGVVKNSNGNTRVGSVSGDLEVSAANGRISVERAQAAVTARSANGDIRLGEVFRGVVVAQTSRGNVEVGVREGVAAWLDLQTKFGSAQSLLADAQAPAPGEDTVDVRARTSFGDILVRRTPASADELRGSMPAVSQAAHADQADG